VRVPRRSENYSSPWWLRGGHAQSIWGKLFRKRRQLNISRRTIHTPDGDEIELHSVEYVPDAPHLLLFHGLEGSLRSHYANGMLAACADKGWNAHLLIFRSCGEDVNLTRRFYHSGDTADVRQVIVMLTKKFPLADFFLVGVSLGGNVLLKYLGEEPERVPKSVRAAAAISVPYDLASSANSIAEGFSRIYQRFFLGTLRQKLLKKRAFFPDLPPAQVIRSIGTMVEFDDIVTAPLHGFAGAADYYERSSALRFLADIRLPTLLLSSYDDPFLPAEVLRKVESEALRNRALHIEFHDTGGHVGFVAGRFPWQAQYYAEGRVLRFLEQFTRGSR
jgi:Predicted hydrolase of the alpha/beta-hydrolase fold